MQWSNLGLARWRFEKGLHDLGSGVYAWLQPDGGWGWSNAGLIADSGQSLLVDTLFDLPLTREMLDAMRDAEPAAAQIDTLVNTHADADHCNGNQLVEGAEIIASQAAAEELAKIDPAQMRALLQSYEGDDSATGRFVRSAFGSFDFEGLRPAPPTRSFAERELELKVGDKRVLLYQVGPAHTRGDVLVHLPEEGVVYTGDIMFVEGTPIIWTGPVQNWIDACDRICDLKPAAVVPGHGPITDSRGAQAMGAYLSYVRDEARQRYEGGMPAAEAAHDIPLGEFAGWRNPERLAVNVRTLYREFGGGGDAAGGLGSREILAQMAELADLASSG